MGNPSRGLVILGASMASNTFLNWMFIYIISCTTNTGILARVTPASGPSPMVPTIKVSTSPRELVMGCPSRRAPPGRRQMHWQPP